MGKFFWVNIESKNYNGTVLMEEGVRFENKGAVYTMGKNGKLSIFSKENQSENSGDTIKLNDYQYQVFKAVMNNDNDEKKVDALSNSDIKKALKLHEQRKLTNDLSEFLKGDYEVENPRRFGNENKFSAYITNGIKKYSGVLSFQFGINSVKATKEDRPIENDKPVEQLSVDSKSITNFPKGAFLGNDLFNHPAINVKKAFTHKVQKGEDLVALARKYEIDTYQLIAANPQLKINKDYKVYYPKDGLAKLTSTLKVGSNITIPARYDVRSGSCNNLKDVAKVTGVSETFLKDFLSKTEVEKQDGNPDLLGYLDDGGTPTIGFGHTGKVYGKPISCRRGKETRITKTQAMEILAEDLLKHKAMTMAYLGKENYQKAPKSVQDAILDVAYNKGIWDGFLTPRGYAASTSKIKNDLKSKKYASALVHTRREKTGFRGLRKRNMYRFISGLKDLTPKQRKAAMNAMKPYYNQVLSQCKSYDRPYLKKAWDNAEKGVCTGYTLR